MDQDEEVRRLRDDLYRAGADSDSVRRYEAARDGYQRVLTTAAPPLSAPDRRRHPPRWGVVGTAAAAAIAVIALAVSLAYTDAIREPTALERGDLSPSADLRWASSPTSAGAQRTQLSRALRDTNRFARLLHDHPALVPMHGAPSSVVTAGTDPILQLDAFGPKVSPSSEVVVVVQCGSPTGRFRIRLSTLVQKDASIQVAPLAVAQGSCAKGAQAIRYRPFLGMLPTIADLQGPAGSALGAILTR